MYQADWNRKLKEENELTFIACKNAFILKINYRLSSVDQKYIEKVSTILLTISNNKLNKFYFSSALPSDGNVGYQKFIDCSHGKIFHLVVMNRCRWYTLFENYQK